MVKPLLYDPRKNTQHNENAELKINSNTGLAQMLSSSSSNVLMSMKFGKSKVGSYLSYQASLTESNFKTSVNIDSVGRNPFDILQPDPTYPRFPLRSMQEVTLPVNLTLSEQAFIQELSKDESEINNIEHGTRKQSDCEEWKAERKYRFTASRNHLISKRQRNHDLFSQSLLYPASIPKIFMEHGLKYEPVALQEYERVMFYRRTPVNVLPCGFVVCQGCGILGASPDGRVIDKGCTDNFGLAEVKCPQTKFQVTPMDACNDPNFCLEKVNDNECRLKRNHPYYTQVQSQMGCTGAGWTDFIVYTRKGIHIERIPFDSAFWNHLQEKLVSYYLTHFLKFALADRELNDGQSST